MIERFQILSLDGGGIKGLFSAAILAAVEADLNISIADHFDLIVGTSTGGIIALGLGLGLHPQQVVDFYVNDGPSIFQNWFKSRNLTHWFYRKFSQRPLQVALQRHATLREKIFGDSYKRLVIASYNLGDDDVYLFKTPHHERLTRDWRLPAWKVALATSAAPTYFPSCRHIDHIRHIDGGIWANNPTMIGIVEAVSMLNVPLEKIHVLSLGTSDPIVKRPRFLDWGGKLVWANHAVGIVMRGQSLGTQKQALHLLGSDNVTRLDPKVPNGLFALDAPGRKEELMAKAAHESRIAMPDIKKKFLDHIAPKYVPCHPRQIESNV
jgi:uncharacterized protein